MDISIAALRAGDQWAYQALYEQAYWYCASYLLQQGAQEADAKATFNRALEIFWTKMQTPDFELSCQPKTYLYAVCRNLWLKQLRKQKKNPILQDEERLLQEPLPHLVQEEVYFLEEEEADPLLMTAMKALSSMKNTDCQKVLELYYFEKKSHREIEQIMGFADNYSKVKKNSCIKQLKKQLLRLLGQPKA